MVEVILQQVVRMEEQVHIVIVAIITIHHVHRINIAAMDTHHNTDNNNKTIKNKMGVEIKKLLKTLDKSQKIV